MYQDYLYYGIHRYRYRGKIHTGCNNIFVRLYTFASGRTTGWIRPAQGRRSLRGPSIILRNTEIFAVQSCNKMSRIFVLENNKIYKILTQNIGINTNLPRNNFCFLNFAIPGKSSSHSRPKLSLILSKKNFKLRVQGRKANVDRII